MDVHLPRVGTATTGAARGDDWRRALTGALARADRGYALGPALLAMAAWCVTASALVWKRGPRTGPRANPALPAGAAEAAGMGRLV
jgi:hypothetical protein